MGKRSAVNRKTVGSSPTISAKISQVGNHADGFESIWLKCKWSMMASAILAWEPNISEWRKSSVLVLGTRGVGATTDFGDQCAGCLTHGKVIVFLPDRPDRLVSLGVSNSSAV